MRSFEHAIQLTDVTVRQNEMVTVDRVSLTIDRGNFAAIIGPNGAGKTTLVKVILGLIKPDSGTVRVFDRPLDELGELRSKIGYVPQIFSIDLKFPVTVFEAVLMGTYGKVGVGRRVGQSEKDAAFAAMEKVGITDLKDRPIARLSGGQRQRAFIARALANSPDLLLLDEPTTGVDVATTGNVYTLLRELKSEGVTVLLVSHDVGVVASYIDTLACLNTSLVAHCRPGEVECNDALKSMYGCNTAFLHHGEAPHIVVEEHD
ncbi:MAG: metal ABC transporter ATP-binding protein [Armatimonadota bacterium]